MTPVEPIVHVVDDDDAIRHAVVFQLETAGHAACEYASAEAFLEVAHAVGPGCVITDVRMPGLSGLELVHRLNALGFKAPVILMTGHGDIPLAVEAMKAGVVDFIEKPLDDDILLQAVASALSKGASSDQDEGRERERKARFGALSPRERDVLVGVIAGKPNKIMAYDLGISMRTVEAHRARLMAKTAASSLSELIRSALSVGF